MAPVIACAALTERLADRARRRDARIAALSDALGRAVTIWGYGWKGRGLAAYAREAGWTVTVFDASAEARSAAERDGFRTVHEVPSEGPVVLAATQAQSDLAGAVGGRGIFFQEMAFLLDMPCLANRSREYADYVVDHAQACHEVLADLEPVSAERYLRLLTFRASCNPLDLEDSNSPVSTMWFDEALLARASDIATFLDVGAYDGDTIRAARRHLGISEAIGLEMSADLADTMRARHDGSYGLVTHSVAAWSEPGTLGQSVVGDGMLKVESGGAADAVPCDTLDNLVPGKVDMIKMDIEGAELPALAGARRIIGTHRPHLAIAAYHRPEDITEIVRTGQSLGYRDIRFAHYSQCNDDSIFYFLRD